MVDNLDSLALTIMGIEAANGRTDVIITSPSAWATLIMLKTGTGSNASLVGAGVEPAARQLLGVEVIVSSAMALTRFWCSTARLCSARPATSS